MKTVFHKIVTKEIPAKVLYEDEKVIAFYDVNPKKPGHFLVVPKVFSENLLTIKDEDLAYLIVKANELAKIEIKKLGVSGYNLLVNNSKEAGQEVFYTHIHIIPTDK